MAERFKCFGNLPFDVVSVVQNGPVYEARLKRNADANVYADVFATGDTLKLALEAARQKFCVDDAKCTQHGCAMRRILEAKKNKKRGGGSQHWRDKSLQDLEI